MGTLFPTGISVVMIGYAVNNVGLFNTLLGLFCW